MGFTGNSESLLATGVVGVVEFLATIPAVLLVDKIGRKKILITGAIGMAVCHFIVAGIIASYTNKWGDNRAAGWAAVVFVWIYVINFAYSWGMCYSVCGCGILTTNHIKNIQDPVHGLSCLKSFL